MLVLCAGVMFMVKICRWILFTGLHDLHLSLISNSPTGITVRYMLGAVAVQHWHRGINDTVFQQHLLIMCTETMWLSSSASSQQASNSNRLCTDTCHMAACRSDATADTATHRIGNLACEAHH
jgi:hypothetical protein